MKLTGINMQNVKQSNRTAVLYLLHREGRMSRKAIAEKSGLTPAAVTIICNELISEGKIRESGEIIAGGKGRHEILLEPDFGENNILCINAETTHITYSVCKLDGTAKKIKITEFTNNTEAVLEETEKLLYDNDIRTENICGIGVCVVGSVSGKGYSKWNSSELCDKLSEKYGVPAFCENNVRAFAQGELLFSGDYESDSVLFFKWGSGIGSAVAADGRVLSGNDMGIAEIGHYIVNNSGRLCRCGRYGCLETEAGEEALVSLTGMPLCEIIQSQDKNIINILDEKIDIVALALTNTATILNAEKIVLFGSVFSNDTIAEKLKRQVLRYNGNLTADMIIKSKLNEKSGYAGPAAICAKKLFFEG